MPVPVPRQRAIPAVECGQAPAASPDSGPSKEQAPPGTHQAENAATRRENTRENPTEKREKPTDTSTETSTGTSSGTGTGTGTDRTPAPGVRAESAAPTNLTVLLIEDDPAGSPIVPDLLDQSGKPIRVRTARNLTEAGRLLTDDVHCILLDLALSAPAPARTNTDGGGSGNGGDAEGDDELAVLRHVLELAPRHAVLALTSSSDAERGAEAVAVGAQDYLFRDELDGRLLSRAIRYAVERKRSDSAERRLAEGRLRAQENRRLERGLLPTPLLAGSPLRFAIEN